MSKEIANDILGVFERYSNGKCTRDKALEDVSKLITDFADKRKIVGYVQTGTLGPVLKNIVSDKKPDQDNYGYYKIKLHQLDIDAVEKMLKSIQDGK